MSTLPTGFKPMLAGTLDLIKDSKTLKYPCFISAKIDGIRCITGTDGTPYTRTAKPIMNVRIVEAFHDMKMPPLLDGELMLGDPTIPENFNLTSGLIRRKDDANFTDLNYFVFDRVTEGSYEDRWINYQIDLPNNDKIKVVRLMQKKVFEYEHVEGWEEHFYKQKYEGIMIRTAASTEYKFGRSSVKSGQLIKYKRFKDDEATITGFEEEQENLNEATKDEFGRSKRSSHKENKAGKGQAGVILCSCPNFDGVVRIGTGRGLTDMLRKDMWENPHNYIGRIITFKYQEGGGYEKTRFGSFQGFRDDFI